MSIQSHFSRLKRVRGVKMYFPLIERRIASKDRRVFSKDRRLIKSQNISQDSKRNQTVRRQNSERRVIDLDRATLLYTSHRGKIGAPEEKKSKVLSFCSAILIPLVIGLSSLLIAFFQVKNAENIANGQAKNARLIAEGQLKNAKTIASTQIESQHLQHLVSIFSTIISPKDDVDKKEGVINQRIRSLAVYNGEALPFLLQIRKHFDRNSTKTTFLAANETIKKIMGQSQLDLSNQIIGSVKSSTNLRHKEYKNYNLDNSKFTNVNLFKANFSGSSLQNSSFTDADLQESSFLSANLKGVVFKGSQLRKTDFRYANLNNVKFIDCTYIEDAKFSLNTVLKAEPDLFGSLSPEKYILLLMTHEQELKMINDSDEEKRKLSKIFKVLKINDFTALEKRFEDLRAKKFANKKQRIQTVQQVSMINI